MLSRILDLRMRPLRRKSGLRDTPEVRRYMRRAWVQGFTFGQVKIPDRVREAALESLRMPD